jgi:glycosyltransferase involved in cell wall biosynthesis
LAARVLMITSDYPTPGKPRTTHFIKRQAEFLQAAGIDVDVFHFQGEKRLVNYAAAWVETRRRLQRGHYDLVHAQFGQSGLLGLPKRVPLVVTLRGSDLLGIVDDRTGRYTWKGRLLQRATRHVARVADAVIVVAAHMAPLVDTTAPLHVIPSGIDLELFHPGPRAAARRALGLESDERFVLFAGRPNQARKRYALAARAVQLLQQRLPARFVVAWGVMHEEMPDYFNACDVLVHTSMQEGSPNVVKEALACNLPVVSVPVGDVAERLAGLEGCELTVDDRPETIADALERVLRRGERCEGRDAVRSLDERLLTRRVIDIYETALRGRAHPARVPAPPPSVPASELQLREATPAEVECWDVLIRQFPGHRIVHTRGWLQSLEASRLGAARYIVAERQGRIVACLPGLVSRLGPLRLFGSPLPGWQTVGMGPLFDAARVDAAELTTRLIPFLRERYGVHHVEIMTDRLPAEAMQAAGFRGEPFHTFRTELKPGDEASTLRGFKDSARRNVKRAEQLGLIVRFEDDDRFCAEHFDQIREVFERGGNVLPFRRDRVAAFVRAMRESGALAGVSVYLPDGTTNIATGTFTIYGRELLLWMWTHRTAYRWFRPTELMTWSVMQRAMQAGCTMLDLAGRGDFKARLGAIPDASRTRWVWSRYRWLLVVRDGAGRIFRWQQRLRGLVRNALRPKVEAVVAEEPAATTTEQPAAPPARRRSRGKKVGV